MEKQNLENQKSAREIVNTDGLPLISGSDILIALGYGKRVIASTVAMAFLVGVALAIFLPPIFLAKTVLLPPQESRNSAANALAGLGALAGVAGVGLGVKSPDELYIGLLKSTSVEDPLVQQFDLRTRYHVKLMQDARAALQKHVTITSDKKSGLISIAVEDRDAKVAADIANAYVGALAKLLEHIAVTEAQRRRVFLDSEVRKSKAALAKAQDEYSKLQAQSGVVSVDADTQLAIQRSAQIRSQLAAKQIELQSLRTFATPENLAVKRVATEAVALQGQLEKIEHGDPGSFKGTDAGQATLRSYREMKYQEAVVDLLSRQLEIARVDEAKDGPLVQQVDVALPPERKAKPSRALILIGSVAGGLLLGVIIVVGRAFLRAILAKATESGDLARIRLAWKIGASDLGKRS